MFSPYANIGATRDVLQQFEMHATKMLGQNFLVNDNVVGHILALANISSDDIVLEVGPGIGTLTYALCNSAGQVVAIERDVRLPRVLEYTLASCDNFTLVSADALSYDISKLHKQPTMLVANLPYAVAATLVLKYFQEIGSLQSATVMVQKEVALRMAACPGNKNYGAYTVKLSLYAQVEDHFDVAPGNFFPQPHVMSSVVRIVRKPMPPGDSSRIFRMATLLADASFAQRRKTIYNSLRAYAASNATLACYGLDKADNVRTLLEKAEIAPDIRAEKLHPSDFLKMAHIILS